MPSDRAAASADPLPDVPRARRPRHIAAIMDGNGRWAQARGLPRLAGHRAGAETVRMAVEECTRLGIEALTLYSFSSENWRRPEDEVDGLMALCVEHLASETASLAANGIRFRQIGRRDRLPAAVVAGLERAEAATAGGARMTLSIALDYGSREEIVRAAQRLAAAARDGTLAPEAIDEARFAAELDTAGLPDPDLLIRTAGEMRVSNYLLWQISYAEIHVTPLCWPDFSRDALHAAIRDFAGRTRRFGGLVPA